MGSALFWGLLLIILGLSFIFRIVFNIDFPVLKILFAFILIFLGIRLLFGSFGGFNVKGGHNDVVFGEKHFKEFKEGKEYNVIFSQGNFDFRDYEPGRDPSRIKINTVFGGSEILIPRELPVKISVDAAFSGANMPNGNSAVFGSTGYESPGFDSSTPHLFLEIGVVFGGVDVKLY